MLEQLRQELTQRKEEFASLKEKVNQVCQTLLEAIEEGLTSEEEELFDMLTDALVKLAPEKNVLSGNVVENLKSRLENSLRGEFENIQQKHATIGEENINEMVEMFYTIYELMFSMYVNFTGIIELRS